MVRGARSDPTCVDLIRDTRSRPEARDRGGRRSLCDPAGAGRRRQPEARTRVSTKPSVVTVPTVRGRAGSTWKRRCRVRTPERPGCERRRLCRLGLLENPADVALLELGQVGRPPCQWPPGANSMPRSPRMIKLVRASVAARSMISSWRNVAGPPMLERPRRSPPGRSR